MTACTNMEERLNDYLDDLLTGAERQEVEGHLEDCGVCQETLGAMRSLRQATTALPESLEPPRDLWPGVRRNLPGGATILDWLPRSIGLLAGVRWQTGLAAAAIVLAAATTLMFMGPGWYPSGPKGHTRQASGSATLVSLRSAETDYLRATDDLLAELDRRRDDLSPRDLAVVEENLRVINEAIQEVWTVLEQEPDNQRNVFILTSMYRKKINLLRKAARLPSQS